MSRAKTPGLFEGRGIELEYMIVEKDTLNVLPISDEVLRSAAGHYANDYDTGKMGWSNELVCHVMEIKNNKPVPSLRGLSGSFHKQITRINKVLDRMGGRLMPSGMHPWMDPGRETRLWPRRYRRVYETYNSIFNCKRHGWANVQSMHINLSFNGDEEFGRLHAAVRMVLPIIPSLAASSPVVSGKVTGLYDTRLLYYAGNQRKVPSIMGKIIPEPVYTKADYREKVFERIYRDIAKYDDKNVLRHEWLNSRGAIPRYERDALEMRIIDTQECPRADIAVAEIIISVLRLLVSEHWSRCDAQKAWKVPALSSIFNKSIRGGENAVIDNSRYLGMFGFPGAKAGADELWQHLLDESMKHGHISAESSDVLRMIINKGTLSGRILKKLGRNPSQKRLRTVYEKLCECLAANIPFSEQAS